MKYDAQIGELKNKLDSASSVLVVLPKEVNVDLLAAALALYLSLKQSGKSAAVVSESELKVSQAALFGIGDIKGQLPESNSGNFVIKLDGVVEGGKVPALEKLDWFPSGSDLNLVFHVQPGKKFEPINISHHYDKTSFQLIFFVGAPTLADFGGIYTNNIGVLGGATKVSIDNSQNNNLFSNVNIIDSNTASISEMVSQILQSLGLPQDADIASNIVTGIYDATQNLTANVSGDTFIAVGQAMQMGAKVPFVRAPLNQGGFDIRKFTSQPTDNGQQTAKDQRPKTQDRDEQPAERAKSQYEVPAGEQATHGNPEGTNPAPDWLTPKVFGGKNLG